MELRELEVWVSRQRGIAAILCTHKDLVKIPRKELAGVPLLAVDVELAIVKGREEFEQRLREAVS